MEPYETEGFEGVVGPPPPFAPLFPESALMEGPGGPPGPPAMAVSELRTSPAVHGASGSRARNRAARSGDTASSSAGSSRTISARRRVSAASRVVWSDLAAPASAPASVSAPERSAAGARVSSAPARSGAVDSPDARSRSRAREDSPLEPWGARAGSGACTGGVSGPEGAAPPGAGPPGPGTRPSLNSARSVCSSETRPVSTLCAVSSPRPVRGSGPEGPASPGG